MTTIEVSRQEIIDMLIQFENGGMSREDFCDDLGVWS